MKERVSIFGLGYVGSVTAACLASKGHSVIGIDLSTLKVEQRNSGHSPIVEAGMKDLVANAHSQGLLRAASDSTEAVLQSSISFLCVGTPRLRTGRLELGHVEPVCRGIGQVLRRKTDCW